MAHQITYKFIPEDKPFFMHDNKVTQGVVKHVQVHIGQENKILYTVKSKESPLNIALTEDRLFTTKEDLLASL